MSTSEQKTKEELRTFIFSSYVEIRVSGRDLNDARIIAGDMFKEGVETSRYELDLKHDVPYDKRNG